jgi:hypothetical protein
MNRLLFNELEARLTRVNTILTELLLSEQCLSPDATDLAGEAEELTNEARDILYQGDAYVDSPLGDCS